MAHLAFRALRQAGRAVAVTGDGANDAPAIRLADVGIALGRHSTPATRQAADIIITDDRIETIVDAVIESRSMWRSVRDSSRRRRWWPSSRAWPGAPPPAPSQARTRWSAVRSANGSG